MVLFDTADKPEMREDIVREGRERLTYAIDQNLKSGLFCLTCK